MEEGRGEMLSGLLDLTVIVREGQIKFYHSLSLDFGSQHLPQVSGLTFVRPQRDTRHTVLPHGNERRRREGSREKTRAGEPQQNQTSGTGDADVDLGSVQPFHHICLQQPDDDRGGANGSQPFRSPSSPASASALPPGRRLPRQVEGRSHHVSSRSMHVALQEVLACCIPATHHQRPNQRPFL